MAAPSLHLDRAPGRFVAPGLDVVAMDADHAKGIAFNMLFLSWRFHTHATAVEPCFVLLQQLGEQYPEGVGVSHVVEADAIAPSFAARRLIADMQRLPIVKHYSVTHEGTGFKAASIRAVVTGIHALSRANCAHSVHSTFARAAEWHARHQIALGHLEAASHISATLELLRARHRHQYP